MKTTNNHYLQDSDIRPLVIIPAFREEKHIAEVVAGAKRHIRDVLVVDDASPDRTYELALKAGAAVVRHPINLGYAAALQTGYKYALARGYSIVVQLDGDGQHDPDDIPQLLTALAHTDMVIGSRFHNAGNYEMPRLRYLGKTFFSLIIQLCTGQCILDPTSGFQALSRPVFSLFATDSFTDEYPDADMLILILRHGFTITEVGVNMRSNDTGQSMHAGILSPIYYMARMSIGVITANFSKPE